MPGARTSPTRRPPGSRWRSSPSGWPPAPLSIYLSLSLSTYIYIYIYMYVYLYVYVYVYVCMYVYIYIYIYIYICPPCPTPASPVLSASRRGRPRRPVWCGIQDFYFEETRVFQAGIRLEYTSMEQ